MLPDNDFTFPRLNLVVFWNSIQAPVEYIQSYNIAIWIVSEGLLEPYFV